MTTPHFNYRRDLIFYGAAALTAFTSPSLGLCLTPSIKPKRVAAITTTYFKGSHADVILGKILEGWEQTGGPGPALELASLYVEQIREDDESVEICRKHNVPMFSTIADTITCGTDHIPVDGILCIAEHGKYPWNERGQHLYPRRRFFHEITETVSYTHLTLPTILLV